MSKHDQEKKFRNIKYKRQKILDLKKVKNRVLEKRD